MADPKEVFLESTHETLRNVIALRLTNIGKRALKNFFMAFSSQNFFLFPGKDPRHPADKCDGGVYVYVEQSEQHT